MASKRERPDLPAAGAGPGEEAEVEAGAVSPTGGT